MPKPILAADVHSRVSDLGCAFQFPTRPVARKQEALPPADAAASVVKLNVHKRDLRTIEEVQQALKARKVEPRAD